MQVRQLNINDAEELYCLIDLNRDYIGNWLPWVAETQSQSDTEAFLLKSIELTKERKGYFCGIFVENNLVGVAGATISPNESNSMFINYWVSKVWSRRGLATQACLQLIRFLESEWCIYSFFATLSDKNIASIRVAEKLGFHFSKSLTSSNYHADNFSADLLYKRIKESTMTDTTTPRLEDADRHLYYVDLATFDIKCNPQNGRSVYILTATLTKKQDKEFTWYTRFDKEAKATFVGADITSPNINTTHHTKLGTDGYLEEIALLIPNSIKTGEPATLRIHYERDVIRTEVGHALGAKRVQLGMFCSLASECKRLEIKICFDSKNKEIVSVLAPAEKNYSDSMVSLSKDNLEPQQFTPVTILLDTGNYRLLQHSYQALWAVTSAILGAIFGFVLGKMIK